MLHWVLEAAGKEEDRARLWSEILTGIIAIEGEDDDGCGVDLEKLAEGLVALGGGARSVPV